MFHPCPAAASVHVASSWPAHSAFLPSGCAWQPASSSEEPIPGLAPDSKIGEDTQLSGITD